MTVDLNNLSLEENKLFNDISIDLKEDLWTIEGIIKNLK